MVVKESWSLHIFHTHYFFVSVRMNLTQIGLAPYDRTYWLILDMTILYTSFQLATPKKAMDKELVTWHWVLDMTKIMTDNDCQCKKILSYCRIACTLPLWAMIAMTSAWHWCFVPSVSIAQSGILVIIMEFRIGMVNDEWLRISN